MLSHPCHHCSSRECQSTCVRKFKKSYVGAETANSCWVLCYCQCIKVAFESRLPVMQDLLKGTSKEAIASLFPLCDQNNLLNETSHQIIRTTQWTWFSCNQGKMGNEKCKRQEILQSEEIKCRAETYIIKTIKF